MRGTLRGRLLSGLLAHTLALYVVMGVGLYLFNLHEQREHPDEIEEERQELLILYGIMFAVLPVAAVAGWFITSHLLRPLQDILHTADRIRAGHLDERIETAVRTDELGRLATMLNEAFDNYHQLLARVDRFSLDAAHQLRNPLASMRTTAEVCLQRPRTREEYEETLARLIETGTALSHTVDQLLLVARLSRPTLDEVFESVDLAALAARLAEDLRPAFEARGVVLEERFVPNGNRVRGAARLLEQAVANLLDNALRHTPGGGRVRIEVAVETPGQVSLSVADSGPGVSPEALPGAPGRELAPVGRTGAEGAGLGLLVVSNVVRAHRGTMQVSPNDWNGATFTLRFPSAL